MAKTPNGARVGRGHVHFLDYVIPRDADHRQNPRRVADVPVEDHLANEESLGIDRRNLLAGEQNRHWGRQVIRGTFLLQNPRAPGSR
jgi:hypothetical protein